MAAQTHESARTPETPTQAIAPSAPELQPRGNDAA
jgi:hypothetical protein